MSELTDADVAALPGAIARSRETPAVDAYLADRGDGAFVAVAHDVVTRAQTGDARAREQLLESLLPMAVSYSRAHRVEGLELADLVQEGLVGVLQALARFDPAVGVPFHAYAAWWIRYALQEARSDFVRPLRLPPKALRQLAQLKSEHGRVYAAEGRAPTVAELADTLSIEREQAEALVRADAATRSLFDPVDAAEGEVGVLGDLLADPVSGDAYEDVVDAVAGAQLRALLGRLSDRERDIVTARYGLRGEEPERLVDIGERLGVSTERVRQLEARALAKLRAAA